MFTLRAAIRPIAATVLPNAVVAANTPVSYCKSVSTAFCWSARSSPLNSTSISLPIIRSSLIVYLQPCSVKKDSRLSRHPLGSMR